MTATNIYMVDTHAHLDMDDFDKDREEVICRALDAGVGTIINMGTDLESSRKAIELAEKHPQILAAVGVEPHEADKMVEANISTLAEMAAHPKVVAIGEIGLDVHRNYSPRPAQLRALKWQLDLAQKLMLPVAIHCRQAEADMVPILKDWTSSYKVQSPGVIHCFSRDSGDAGQYLDMDFYLALGAYIGYPGMKEMHDIIRDIPEDRLLVETDCPFRPPQIYRGQRNEPSYIPIVVETLAEIRGESPEAIAHKTTQNARNLFRIKD